MQTAWEWELTKALQQRTATTEHSVMVSVVMSLQATKQTKMSARTNDFCVATMITVSSHRRKLISQQQQQTEWLAGRSNSNFFKCSSCKFAQLFACTITAICTYVCTYLLVFILPSIPVINGPDLLFLMYN